MPDLFDLILPAKDLWSIQNLYKQSKVVPDLDAKLGSTEPWYTSSWPDTSLHCGTTVMGLVHCVVRLFTAQPIGRYTKLYCLVTKVHRRK